MQKWFNKIRHMTLGVILAVNAEDVPSAVEPIPPKPISIEQIITNVIQLILGFSAALAVLFIIIGGLRYITSAGNPDAASNAMRIILYATIGLLLIVLSYVLVFYVESGLAPILVE